jgi:hypothetical protein
MSDHVLMITLIAIIVGLGVVDALALKFGEDTRPGFDERRPLS